MSWSVEEQTPKAKCKNCGKDIYQLDEPLMTPGLWYHRDHLPGSYRGGYSEKARRVWSLRCPNPYHPPIAEPVGAAALGVVQEGK